MDRKKNIADIPEWFKGSRLNFAENLLRYEDNRIAIYTAGINWNSSFHNYINIMYNNEFCVKR